MVEERKDFHFADVSFFPFLLFCDDDDKSLLMVRYVFDFLRIMVIQSLRKIKQSEASNQ